MLYLWLYPLHDEFAIFNVFRYLSFRMIYAAITAFLIVFFLAPPVIRKLQELGLGAKDSDRWPTIALWEIRHPDNGRYAHSIFRPIGDPVMG